MAIRKTRLRTEAPQSIKMDKKQLTELVDGIVEAAEQAVIFQNKVKADTELLKTFMLGSKLSTFRANKGVAEIFYPKGRNSYTIDPEKFRAAVTDDKDFFQAISVSNEKAKEVLSGKQLDAITTTKVGGTKDPEVKIDLIA